MTDRTHRIRRIGLLGVALTTLLSPAGILISSAIATTALVGGLALHAQRSTPTDPEAHPRAPALFTPEDRRLATGAPETILIEHQGQKMPIVLDDGTNRQKTQQRLDTILLAFGIPPASSTNPDSGQPRRGSLPESTLPGNGPGVGSGIRPQHPAPKNQVPTQEEPPATPPSVEEGPDKSPGTPKPTSPPSQDEPPAGPPTVEGGPGKSPDTPKLRIAELEDNTPARPKITALWDDPALLPQSTLVSEGIEHNPAAIPEPSVLGLMGLGLVAMMWMARRQRALIRRA